MRYLLIWLESRGHDFNLGSGCIGIENPDVSGRTAIVGFRHHTRIEVYLWRSRLVLGCPYDLLEAIPTLPQNRLIISKITRLNLQVALVVVGVDLLSKLRSGFESSARLIGRSLGAFMDLVFVLEVSILEHLVHLRLILVVHFISVAIVISSRYLDLFLGEACHAGPSCSGLSHVSILKKKLL